VIVLVALVAFAALAVVFRRRVAGWHLLAAKNLAAALMFLAVVEIARRLNHGPARFLVRMGAVSLACAYLFGSVDPLQLVLHGRWMDGTVLALEERLFSVQPTLWLQRFVRPWLTEWMMFAYVVYLPLYPLVCAAIWARSGERAAEEVLLGLGLANVLCDVGFIVFPVAGPVAVIGARFTVPLQGWVFTSLGELVRARLHFVGGSLPSPHCAAATVLWGMAWRHCRWLFWLLAPVVLTLYVSTVYGRYHYVTDAVTGIALALTVLAATPGLLRVWERALGSR
jgi:membrane-associated phospholipid phosphatase